MPGCGAIMCAMTNPTLEGCITHPRFARTLGELAYQIFVASPDDIRLHVVESEPLCADLFDQVRQAPIIDITQTVRRGIEVNAINDAF